MVWWRLIKASLFAFWARSNCHETIQCVAAGIVTAASSLVILVFQQLAVSAGESVARLAEKLQRLLLVDVAEDGLLRGKANSFWETDRMGNAGATGRDFLAVSCKQ